MSHCLTLSPTGLSQLGVTSGRQPYFLRLYVTLQKSELGREKKERNQRPCQCAELTGSACAGTHLTARHRL